MKQQPIITLNKPGEKLLNYMYRPVRAHKPGKQGMQVLQVITLKTEY